MKRKNLLALITCLLVLALTLGACGGDSKKETESTKAKSETSKKSSGKKVSSTNENAAFNKKVKKVCESVDTSVFDDIETAAADAMNDPEAFGVKLQAAEDELDRIISELEDIEAPDEHADEWDTFIEDFEAIRDALPEMSRALTELVQITQTVQNDPATATAAQARLEEIQNELEPLLEDLDQRAQEIKDISYELGIDDCAV